MLKTIIAHFEIFVLVDQVVTVRVDSFEHALHKC